MFLRILKFLLPVLLWLFLMRDLLSGRVPLQSEPFADLAMLKFYLTNLREGVVPLWNPYLFCGFSWLILLNFFGFANPVWGVTLLLNIAGVKFYFAFLYTVVFYFFIGLAGFYLLARSFLNDSKAAYIAFLFLLFSSIGLISLQEYNMLFIYVPTVWFFCFCVSFTRDPNKISWLGIVLTLILAGQAYLPFYFVTVLLMAFMAAVIVCPAGIPRILGRLLRFFRKNVLFVFLTILVLLFCLYPAFMAYYGTLTHDIVLPWRHRAGHVLSGGAMFKDYSTVAEAGLIARMSPEDLYGHFDRILYPNDGFVFIPGFAILVILLGSWNRINKKIAILALFFTGLLFVVLGNVTPVHRFLYNYIGYFSLMRNLHFFLPFLLSAAALMAAEHAKNLLSPEGLRSGPGTVALFIIALVHGSVLVFLLRAGNAGLSSIVTVSLSALFWGSFLAGNFWGKKVFLTVLFFICLLFQPLDMWQNFRAAMRFDTAPIIMKNKNSNPGAMRFVFERKIKEQSNSHRGTDKDKLDNFYEDYMSMTDILPTKMEFQQCPLTYSTYLLFNSDGFDAARNYAKTKFVFYDAVKLINPQREAMALFAEALRENRNMALISSQGPLTAELESFLRAPPAHSDAAPLRISGPSEILSVKSFDANQVKLAANLDRKRFLVYNDSYVPGWKALIDGKQTSLYLANVAFKGIFVPSGYHEISLIYDPLGFAGIPFLILVIVWVMALLLIAAIFRLRNIKPRSSAI